MAEIKLKQNIKLILKKIPTSNGVYFFFGKNKKLLYIGKAANLKNRVSQYFTGKTYSPFLKYLLDEVWTVDFEVKNSEIEALISESQLIKKFKPKYNQKLRDDKQYFYVGITKENFPKIFLTHRPDAEVAKALSHTVSHRPAKSEYIGPFTDGAVLKSTLRFLRRAFPYCTCKQKHNNYCLNYHIGKCLGVCCLKQQGRELRIPNSRRRQSFGGQAKFQKILSDYKKNIKAIKEILTGKRGVLIKKLKKELMELAKKEEFEKAIDLRGKIEKLERVFENAKIIYNSNKFEKITALEKLKRVFNLPRAPKRIEGYDVSNIQGTNATGSMIVFTNGQPDKNEYRKFKIRTKITPDDIAMLKEVLIRRFNHPEWQYPDLILIDGGRAQLNVAIETLRHLNIEIPVISLSKRGQEVLFKRDTVGLNAKAMSALGREIQNLIKHIDSEAHRFAISYYRKLHRSQLK